MTSNDLLALPRSQCLYLELLLYRYVTCQFVPQISKCIFSKDKHQAKAQVSTK